MYKPYISMKNLLKAFLLFIALFLVTMHVNARKFYVSSSYTGSTSNGALATPWKSLANVQSNMSTFTSGDTISFKCGDTFTGTLTITKSGSAGNPIVFNSYSTGAKPLLTGTGVAIDYLIQSNYNYLVVDGFQIIDPVLTDTGRSEIAHIRRAITFRGTYCVAKNNEISRAGIGIYISTGSYATIDNNTIHHLKMIVNDIINPDNDYGGAPIWLAGNNNTVINNTCYSNWAISYDYGTDGGGFEFFDEGIGAKNNFMGYNTMYENNGLCETSYNGACDSNTFVYNKFVNNGNVVYLQDSCFGWKFYNNVIVENLALQGAVNAPLFSGRGGYMSQIEMRNNIFQKSTAQVVVNTARFFSFTHTNNIYKLSGSATLGFTLSTAEISTSANIWTTVTGLPQIWDFHLISGSPAINSGINVGLTRDFAGTTVSNPPSMGIYTYISGGNTCIFTYSDWTTCTNRIQTRTYSSSPFGCTGTPPTDSLSRNCVTPCMSFTYGAWTTCIGTQTRPYTASPSGCITTPPIDSIQRTCSVPCVFTYGAWTNCNGTSQTRSYTTTTVGCTGLPPTDSITRSCTTCIPPATITYSAWSTCINNIQTRSYTKNPPDCPDVPSVDSIQRSCTALCTSFSYGSWNTCTNGIQTRSYIATPSGCIGTPPIDSIQRTCSIGCVFSYGTWTTCSSGRQTRSYSASPAGCSGTPPTDSVSRACSGTPLYLTVTTNRQASCNNKSDGYIIVRATGGVSPFYYSINSTTKYTLNKTTFSGLPVGTYTIRVRDSIGTIYTITVKVTSRRNRNC